MEDEMDKFGDARDRDGSSSRSTMPPRTRVGHDYPGGRHMRRALRRLRDRRDGEQAGRGSDHGLNKKGGAGVTLPGTMK